MLLGELSEKLDECFGLAYALDGDKVGLQIGRREWDVKKIMTAMEVTSEVIDEAASANADLLVVFHPLVYRPLLNLTDDELISSFALDLLEKKIAVYVVHTALDTHPDGNNFNLAKSLGIENVKALVESPDFIEMNDSKDGLSTRGMGVIGKWWQSYESLLAKCSDIMGCVPRFTASEMGESIKSVAIVCGSGLSFANQAKSAGADVFITADVSYHMFRAYGKMKIIDPGHWEMEQWSGRIMSEMLRVFFSKSDLAIFECGVRTNFAKQFNTTPKQT